MRRTWISAAAVAAISIMSAGQAWAQVSAGSAEAASQNRAPATQETQNGRGSPPGAENMDKGAERTQNAVPTDESQLQKPVNKPGSD
jgi:hypothetical protein